MFGNRPSDDFELGAGGRLTFVRDRQTLDRSGCRFIATRVRSRACREKARVLDKVDLPRVVDAL